MAITVTEFQQARIAIDQAGKFGNTNLKVPNYNALAAFMNGSSMLFPSNPLDAKSSTKQPVSVPVLQKVAPGTKTVRQCDGAGTGSVAEVPITLSGITEEFAISELEHKGNDISRERMFQYLLLEKTKAIYTRLNNAMVAYLEANKSPVNAGTFFGAIAAGAKTVPYADREDFFSGILAEMAANNIFPPLDMIGDFNLMQLYMKQMNQGTNNSVNTAFGTAPFNAYWAPIANGAGVFGTSYVFEPGTVGLYTWINQLHRDGAAISDAEVWTTQRLPALPGMAQGLEVELKIKRKCADNSTNVPGGEADLITSYTMHVDYTALSPYSEGTDSYIYKYELASAV